MTPAILEEIIHVLDCTESAIFISGMVIDVSLSFSFYFFQSRRNLHPLNLLFLLHANKLGEGEEGSSVRVHIKSRDWQSLSHDLLSTSEHSS